MLSSKPQTSALSIRLLETYVSIFFYKISMRQPFPFRSFAAVVAVPDSQPPPGGGIFSNFRKIL